jgi:hypothetical protein
MADRVSRSSYTKSADLAASSLVILTCRGKYYRCDSGYSVSIVNYYICQSFPGGLFTDCVYKCSYEILRMD